MGAWGFNILENDSSADAHEEYVNHMNAGLSPDEAVAKIRVDLAEMLEDSDDAAFVWLGVAKAQWEYGHIAPEMIDRVEVIASSDAHLEGWESSDKGRQKRKKVLDRFVAKLRSPNTRPKKPRKAKLRKPIYEPGTCLAIAQPDGRFLAGLVTFHVIENSRPGQDTFGINCVALLDYLEAVPPTVKVFDGRNFAREEIREIREKPWLPIVRSAYSEFHRKSRDSLTVVGRVTLSRADALLPRHGVSWNFEDVENLIDTWRSNCGRSDLLLADRLEDIPQWRIRLMEVDEILGPGKAGRPPRESLEQQIDLTPLKAL